MGWAERTVQAWDDETRSWDAARAEAMNRNRKLVTWLSRTRWDIFWTQTFRHRTSENGALAKWSRSLAEFNSHLTVTDAIYAVERHAHFPSHHVHALLSMKRPLRWTNWTNVYRPWKEWCWRTMGKALIVPCRANAPLWYVLKYVTKSVNDSWWTARMQQLTTPENLWGVLTNSDLRSTVFRVTLPEYLERIREETKHGEARKAREDGRIGSGTV